MQTFCMNLGAEFLMQFFAKPFQEVLPYCDIIFGNETEALAYGKANGLKTTEIADIAKHLQAVPMVGGKRARTVVITQGKDSTIVVSGADGAVSMHAVEVLDSSLVVDTNGAGDSFCGEGGLVSVVGRSFGWSVGWLVGWSFGRWVGWLVVRSGWSLVEVTSLGRVTSECMPVGHC